MVASRVAAALLVSFALRAGHAAWVKGPTADEPHHLAYAEQALDRHTFERGPWYFNSKMPVTLLNAAAARLATALGVEEQEAAALFAARLATVLLGTVLGWLVFAWARSLFGPGGGLLALLLYSCCPSFLAHSGLVTTDVATSLGVFAAVFALWRWTAEPDGPRLALAALAFGLAQLAKVTALFLVPILGLLLLWRGVAGRGAAPGWRRLALAAAALGGGAVALIALGFAGEGVGTPLGALLPKSAPLRALAATPAGGLPLPLPAPYVRGIDMTLADSGRPNWSYLHGRHSTDGFPHYFLVALGIKTPLGSLLLVALAAGLALTGRARAPGAEAFLWLPPLLWLAYFSLAFNLQIGLRHVLPAVPFLFVAAGRVVPWARGRRPWAALAAGLALWTASTFWIHPHYLAYFNETVGGPGQGWRWLIDSNLDWGQDHAEVERVAAGRLPPLIVDPGGPIAGRVAVPASGLAGTSPREAQVYAWLRDHFRPVDSIGYSWLVFDVSPEALAACCRDAPQVLPERRRNAAWNAWPSGGGEGVEVRFPGRLTDQLLTGRGFSAAALSVPARDHPVRAWFAVEWPDGARPVRRVIAYPSLAGQPPAFRALDYVLEYRDGERWVEIPGTRVRGNRKARIEHAFPPVVTAGIRLVVETQRNHRGQAARPGKFRAVCRELAAFSE